MRHRKRIYIISAIIIVIIFGYYGYKRSLEIYAHSYGYIDKTGKIIVPGQFYYADTFTDGLGQVSEKLDGPQDQYYFMTPSGTVAFEMNDQFNVSNFFEGRAAIRTKGEPVKTGYIDKQGAVVIKPRFNYLAGDFSEGVAAVYEEGSDKSGVAGYINPQGDWVVKLGATVESFSEGLAVACVKYGQCGYINHEGRFVVPPMYSVAGGFSSGRAYVVKDKKVFFIDKTGKKIFELPENLFVLTNTDEQIEYHKPTRYAFDDGLLPVSLVGQGEGKEVGGFINTDGKIVIPLKFKIRHGFSEGLALVSQGEKLFFIDTNGKKAFDLSSDIDTADRFSEGLSRVYSQGKYGYIDKVGNVVISPQFSLAGHFSSGLAAVQFAPPFWTRPFLWLAGVYYDSKSSFYVR
jgi:hypothetical protein